MTFLGTALPIGESPPENQISYQIANIYTVYNDLNLPDFQKVLVNSTSIAVTSPYQLDVIPSSQGRYSFTHNGSSLTWFQICTINGPLKKNISMELLAVNDYTFSPNVNKTFKIQLFFINGDGISYLDSNTTGVTGRMYADLNAYIVSDLDDTVGSILMIGSTVNTNLCTIWIRLNPRGGIVSFKSDSPEYTTFVGTSGQFATSINGVTQPMMYVTASRVYHDKYPQNIGRYTFFHGLGPPNDSWYLICKIDLGSYYNKGKHIAMELVGSNG